MFIQRKDKGCEARVLGINGNRVLIEAKWAKQRNILFVDAAYFQERYGREAKVA